MRVNKNLLINNDKLTNPGYEKEKSTVSFKDGRIYFNGLNSFISNMTIGGTNENLSEGVDLDATYYVGVCGKSDKILKIYKGDRYLVSKTIGDFHYIEVQGDKIKGATYILSNENAIGYIYGLGVYKDYPSEMYMPNVKSLEPSKQAVFISGGIQRDISTLKIKASTIDQLSFIGVGYVS